MDHFRMDNISTGLENIWRAETSKKKRFDNEHIFHSKPPQMNIIIIIIVVIIIIIIIIIIIK